MKLYGGSLISRFLKDERGQTLPIMALALVAFCGVAALSVDIGNAYACQSTLQASSNAAALAGGEAMAKATTVNAVTAAATSYSSLTGDKNASGSFQATMKSGYPKLVCLTTLRNQGLACTAPLNANAVQVIQTAQVPLYFARVFGKTSLTLNAMATSSAAGGSGAPTNVAVVIDETPSMTAHDSTCGMSKIACALQGLQSLLLGLSPSVQSVAIFQFPEVSSGTAGNISSCNGSSGPTPTAITYDFPLSSATSYAPTTPGATYQILGYLNDYRTSNSATTLNASNSDSSKDSNLAVAAGAENGCWGLRPPSNGGDYQTFYAPAIYAAQASLAAAQTANPLSKNVMIILSDGDASAPQGAMSTTSTTNTLAATANGSYPSWNNQCAQGVAAAQAATAAGTTVYTVGYDVPPTHGNSSSGCSTDSTYTACTAMQAMASTSSDYFADAMTDGYATTCASTQPSGTISGILQTIAQIVSIPRLIPNNTP